ncbi:MAG: glycosyltransferase family 2 protein [Chitinophagales bacterium]|nr:glycosyltransferase family 2 protein [Chitinophagales bacterium]
MTHGSQRGCIYVAYARSVTMNTIPRVTVLMPVFNGERLLERSLTSILNQTFSSFEIIILDNLSTDSTPIIVRRLAEQDNRIRYVLDNQHRTSHEAANYLMEMATREFCISASDDDIWEPHLLATLVSMLDAEPQAGIAVPNTRSVDLKDQPVGRPFLKRYEISLMRSGPFFFWWTYLVKRNVVPLIFALFRTSVWKSSSFKTFDWTGADVDNLFVLSVSKNHKIAVADEVLFGYRGKVRPKPPGKRPTWFSETWNHYKYYVPHQAKFTGHIRGLIISSNFNLIQKSLLVLRSYWAFIIHILLFFPIGLLLERWRRDTNHELDKTIAEERLSALQHQTTQIGYLWFDETTQPK